MINEEYVQFVFNYENYNVHTDDGHKILRAVDIVTCVTSSSSLFL